ncbi:UNVERIFIED_CONTAM: SRPBCC family protein [Actinomycetes bacterium ARC8]|nr:SRPBCC family protein [Actinomycetes bacterium ARC8]
MPVVEESVVVARPPQEVFDFVSKFQNVAVFDSSVTSSEQAGGRPPGRRHPRARHQQSDGQAVRLDRRGHRVRSAPAHGVPFRRGQAGLHHHLHP